MAPNNIDTKIREQLASREIKPSEQAWDRLDAMLSVGETKKKKNYSWLYIAASFVLFSSVGFWFYNQDDSKIIVNDDNFVVTEKENETNKNNSIDSLEFKNNVAPSNILVVQGEIVVDNTIITTTPNNNRSSKKEQKLKEAGNQSQSQIVVAQNNEVIQNEQPVEQTSKNRYITGETLLAAIENRPVEKKQVLNNEVSSKVRVNTSSLLTSVETELDENHKETAIDKLTRNFKQVKSALANRNYEE